MRDRLGAALLAGLAWGLALALIEGLPLLLAGSFTPHLGSRLLALAYLAALYGVLCAVVAAVLLSVLQLLAAAARPRFVARGSAAAPVDRRSRAGFGTAALAMPVTAILLAHRLNPTPWGWAGIALVALAAGLAAARLSGAAGPLPGRAGRALGGLVVGLFAVALGAVLAVALYRGFLRDRPASNPPLASETATADRPNIVLITAGGLRADHLSAYGGDPAVSPNVGALAARGVRFDNAVAPGAWTVPSLASLFTSLYPSALDIECRPNLACYPDLDRTRITLAEALRAAGYGTAGFVGSAWPAAASGLDQGFDIFESVRAEEPFDLGPMQSRTLGRLLGCRRGSAACRLFARGHALLFAAPLPAGYGGDEINGRAARFLDLHGHERFFLWLHYADALPPYDLEPPFRPLPDDPLASAAKRLKNLGYWEMGDPFTVHKDLLPVDAAGLSSLYDGEVHRIDRLLGGLIGQLDARDLSGRTLVVFAGDHGQEFLEHGGYTYGHTLYEEVVRVPLIVAGPGATAGLAVTSPVSLIDLLPTLVAASGAVRPPEAEGRSLVPALSGRAVEERAAYSESLYRVPYELKAIRRGDYKLILNVEDGTVALYDLRADPDEQHDRAAAEPQLASGLAAELRAWLARTAVLARALPRAAPPAQLRDGPW